MSDAGEDDSRDIFNGSIDSIVDVLVQFAKEDNVTICGYKDEAKTTSKAKVVHGKRGVVAQANVPAALRSLQENLAFRKKDIKKACKKTHKRMRKNTSAKSPWNEMSEQEISDWVETHVRRIRSINRIISQNENKKKRPPWVEELPWHKSNPIVVGDQPKIVRAETLDNNSVRYGFNDELMLPWRSQPGSNDQDTGLPIEEPTTKPKEDLLEAKWADGHSSVATYY